jgi:hypothetical protein
MKASSGDANLYRYAANMAPNATDPSGLEVFLPTSVEEGCRADSVSYTGKTLHCGLPPPQKHAIQVSSD